MSSLRNNQVKILMLLGQDFLRPNIDPRVYKEAKSLVKAGYEVDLISFSQYSGKEENFEGIKVHILYDLANLPKFRKQHILLKLPKIISGTLANLIKIGRLANKIKFDVIHCHDADTLIFGLFLKLSHWGKPKLIYDSHEIASEMSNFNNFKPFIRFVERIVSLFTDGFITVNDSVKKYLWKLYPRFKKNSMVIKNVPFLYFNEKTPGTNIYKQIIYQGNLKPDRIQALKRLIDILENSKHKWQLTILTNKTELKDPYFTKYPQNVKVLNLIKNPEKFARFLLNFDLGIIAMNNDCLNNYFALPNKLFDYMASGMAVLAPDYPEIRSVIKKEQAGFIYKDDQDLKLVIESIIARPKSLEKMKKNSYRAIQQRYNWLIEEKKLILFYNKLLKS